MVIDSFGQTPDQLLPHLITQGINKKIGHWFGPVFKGFAKNTRLVHGMAHCPMGLHQRCGKPFGHELADIFIGPAHNAKRALLRFFI